MKVLRASILTLAIAGAALLTPAASLAKTSSGSGVDSAGTTPTSGTASPVDLSTLLVLNKSDTTTNGAKETILEVAGLDLLSKSGNGINGGALAVAGTVLDTLNSILCKGGQEASGFCIGLLFSNTTSNSTTNNASGSTVAVTLGKYHLRLLGSESSTTHTSSGCVSTSLAYLANWENITVLPGSALENGSIAGPGAC